MSQKKISHRCCYIVQNQEACAGELTNVQYILIGNMKRIDTFDTQAKVGG
jgi:hypothetical protein